MAPLIRTTKIASIPISSAGRTGDLPRNHSRPVTAVAPLIRTTKILLALLYPQLGWR